MNIRLTDADLSAAFARFIAIYGHKGAWAYRHPESTEGVQFVKEWLNVLNAAKIQPQELRLAVDAWLAEERKDGWPQPGQLKALVYARYGTAKPPIFTGAFPDEPGRFHHVQRADGTTVTRWFPDCMWPTYYGTPS